MRSDIIFNVKAHEELMLTSLKHKHRICSRCISFADEWEIFPYHVGLIRNLNMLLTLLNTKPQH